jgi:hypothetical protein
VKSGRRRSSKGLEAFRARELEALRVVITPENFAAFSRDPAAFLAQVARR